MTTPKRIFSPGEFYHVYNRGVGKNNIFLCTRDYERFLNTMLRYKDQFGISIVAYSLMPNHFHFFVKEPEGSSGDKVQIFFHRVFTAYSKYFSLKYKETHSGHVFQGRFQSKHVNSESYFLQLLHYIHRQASHHKVGSSTPGVVPTPGVESGGDLDFSWPYSSLHDYLLSANPQFRLVNIADEIVDVSHYRDDFLNAKTEFEEEF